MWSTQNKKVVKMSQILIAIFDSTIDVKTLKIQVHTAVSLNFTYIMYKDVKKWIHTIKTGSMLLQ